MKREAVFSDDGRVPTAPVPACRGVKIYWCQSVGNGGCSLVIQENEKLIPVDRRQQRV